MKRIAFGASLFGLIALLSPLSSHASTSVILMNGAPIAVGQALVGGEENPTESVTFTMDLSDSADPMFYQLVQNATDDYMSEAGTPNPAASKSAFSIVQFNEQGRPVLQFDLASPQLDSVTLRKKKLTLKLSAASIVMNEPHWVPPVYRMNQPHWVPPVYSVSFKGVGPSKNILSDAW